MFKTATAKLAHNAMIPALAGNSRLQPLQDVITAEKLVLQSYVHDPAKDGPNPDLAFSVSRESARDSINPLKL